MGDPITMAVIGGGIGAMMSPRDPLKGAMLGAVGGYGGGAMLGAASSAATTAGSAGLTAGGGALAPTLGSTVGAGGTAIGGTTGLTAPAFTGFGLTPASTGMAAGQASLTAPTAAGLGISPAAPSFAATLNQVPGVIGDYVKQNPMQSLNMANSLLGEQQQQPMPQPQLMRGSPSQIAQTQYPGLNMPRISLI